MYKLVNILQNVVDFFWILQVPPRGNVIKMGMAGDYDPSAIAVLRNQI